MKRSALHTIRLSSTLAKEGHPGATPRRLERWSKDGLGPSKTLSFRGEVTHFAQVDELSRVGRPADLVSRRLAARGFACERLRGAILRELGISPEPSPVMPPMPDLSSGPSGDAAFAAVEHLAHAMVADTRGLPPLMVRGLGALYRNATHRAERLGEPAEVIFHSFLVNGLVHLMGGDYYNGEALEAVLGLDRGVLSADMLHTMNTQLRISLPAIDKVYRTVSGTQIVLMAQRLTEWAPHMLRYLGISGAKQAVNHDRKRQRVMAENGSTAVVEKVSLTEWDRPQVARLTWRDECVPWRLGAGSSLPWSR